MTDIPKTYEGLFDLILRDQFLHLAPSAMKSYLQRNPPTNFSDMLKLADNYSDYPDPVIIRSAPQPFFKRRPTYAYKPNRPMMKSEKPVHVQQTYTKSQDVRRHTRDYPPATCYTCKGRGHSSQNCPSPRDVRVCANVGAALRTRQATINGRKTKMLVDTGASISCINARLVRPEQYLKGSVRIRCVMGHLSNCPRATVHVMSSVFNGTVTAAVIKDMQFGFILSPEQCDTHTDDIYSVLPVTTRAQRERSKQGPPALKIVENTFPQLTPSQLSHLQQEDKSLSSMLKLARKNTVTSSKHATMTYFMKDGLAFRRTDFKKDGTRSTTCLFTPTPLRPLILSFAHDSIMSGHQGARRTEQRVREDFFWPGLGRDVHSYIRTCTQCQQHIDRGRVSRVPLEIVPTVEEPFQKVAVDIIGPIIPAAEGGYRYILTIVDFATRYPEAVALKGITAIEVADALIDVFSRTGVPREILSDQGTQFTSAMMAETMRLLACKQLFSSPYHAQSNGLVERFNGTIKKMLIKMASEQPDQWPRFLAPLLFAYREIPQESTGFSPFQLLYGRQPRGPLKLIKETWVKGDTVTDNKDVHTYVAELRQRLAETCHLAQESIRKKQPRYKRNFDRTAVERDLEPGQLVLLLRPTHTNRMQMHWRGPFLVLKRVKQNDYSIQIGNKQKVYHINMLKRFYERSDEQIHSVNVALIQLEDSNFRTDMMSAETMSDPTVTVDQVEIDSNLTAEQHDAMSKLLNKHARIFTDQPGHSDLVEHRIKLLSDKPIRLKQYPQKYESTKYIAEQVLEMQKQGVIEQSISPYSSPVVLVKKKDGTLRFCVDYRQLNEITEFDAEPIPNQDELFAQLTKAHYFSKFDMCKGYWQLSVAIDDRPKTAFPTPLGLFQFCRLPFGLANAPATFARFMRKLPLESVSALNFFDDILVATETWDQHLSSVGGLLDILERHGLTVKPSKVRAGFREIEFLGHIIKDGQIGPNVDLTAAIRDMTLPTTKKQVRAVLGLVGYYRKFVPNFSTLLKPLTDLTGNKQPTKIRWTAECSMALDKVKDILTRKPVLQLPDFDKRFIVRTDASDEGLGAILLQETDNEYLPVAYASKKLLDRETRYSTIEKECLAIVWALKKFSAYLYSKPFILQCDHKPLTYLRTSMYDNARLTRWTLLLQEYNFVVEHIAGRENSGADALSRHAITAL